MDPSQLFGAWLDDTTFLGGSLEISLDRFATTVQIEAHEVCIKIKVPLLTLNLQLNFLNGLVNIPILVQFIYDLFAYDYRDKYSKFVSKQS
jgi:hypothetical protein